MPRLEEFFQRYARGRGVGIAHEFAQRVRKKLSVRGAKGTPAIRLAPPRLITGDLYRSVKEIATRNGVRVVVWKPYGFYLEYSRKNPHRFLKPVLEEMGLEGKNSG